MKKVTVLLALILCLLLVACMVSCGDSNPSTDPSADTSIGADAATPPSSDAKPGGTETNGSHADNDPDFRILSGLPPYSGPAYHEQMPTIYINTENGASVHANKQDVNCLVSLRSNIYSLCANELPATIRTRGNGSLSAASSVGKLPFKIKFNQKINPFLLGDRKAKDWVLLDHTGEQSMLRNYAARLLGDMLDGIPYSTNSCFVHVYLNNQYYGVYELAEQVEVAEGRIEVNDAVSTPEIGFLVELDSYADDVYVQVGGQKYTIKSNIYSAEQKEFIRDCLEQVEEAIYSNDFTVLFELLDMDSVVDMYLVQEYAKNIDVGWSSFYMYRDIGGKLTFAPPWDFDLSFGNDARLDNGAYEGFYVGASRGMMQDHQWYNALNEQEWFRRMVAGRWAEISNTVIPQLIQAVRNMGQEIAPDMQKNYERWNILGQKRHQEPAQIYRLTTYQQHVDYLFQWMFNRKAWLDKAFAP